MWIYELVLLNSFHRNKLKPIISIISLFSWYRLSPLVRYKKKPSLFRSPEVDYFAPIQKVLDKQRTSQLLLEDSKSNSDFNNNVTNETSSKVRKSRKRARTSALVVGRFFVITVGINNCGRLSSVLLFGEVILHQIHTNNLIFNIFLLPTRKILDFQKHVFPRWEVS